MVGSIATARSTESDGMWTMRSPLPGGSSLPSTSGLSLRIVAVETPAALAIVSSAVRGGTASSAKSIDFETSTSSKSKRSRLLATIAAARILGTYFEVSEGITPARTSSLKSVVPTRSMRSSSCSYPML